MGRNHNKIKEAQYITNIVLQEYTIYGQFTLVSYLLFISYILPEYMMKDSLAIARAPKGMRSLTGGKVWLHIYLVLIQITIVCIIILIKSK